MQGPSHCDIPALFSLLPWPIGLAIMGTVSTVTVCQLQTVHKHEVVTGRFSREIRMRHNVSLLQRRRLLHAWLPICRGPFSTRDAVPRLVVLTSQLRPKGPGRQAALRDAEGLVAGAHALLGELSPRPGAAHEAPAAGASTCAQMSPEIILQLPIYPRCWNKQQHAKSAWNGQCTSALPTAKYMTLMWLVLPAHAHLKPARSASACSGVARCTSASSRASMPSPSRKWAWGMGPRQSAAAPLSSTVELRKAKAKGEAAT